MILFSFDHVLLQQPPAHHAWPWPMMTSQMDLSSSSRKLTSHSVMLGSSSFPQVWLLTSIMGAQTQFPLLWWPWMKLKVAWGSMIVNRLVDHSRDVSWSSVIGMCMSSIVNVLWHHVPVLVSWSLKQVLSLTLCPWRYAQWISHGRTELVWLPWYVHAS